VGPVAVALLGDSTAGKSTLSVALLAAGSTLVSDDLLPLHRSPSGFETYPSAPTTRLWPDAAAHFVGDPSALERVVPTAEKRKVAAGALGSADTITGPRPLAAIYAIERSRDARDVRVEPLEPSRALMALLALSFLGEPLEHLPLRAGRLAALARAAREVPVRRLRYPSGFEHLPRVAEVIIADALATRP
jgi:hypothetical protein